MNNVSLIPETIIYKLVKLMISVTQEDVANKTNKEAELLWRIFGDFVHDAENNHVEVQQIGKYKLYDQAKKIFTIDPAAKQDQIYVGIGYDLKRVELGYPAIHILLPHESAQNAPIGGNEGYLESVVDESTSTNYPVYAAETDVVYNLMITSKNMNEVVVLYHWLKSTALSFHVQFELRDFKNVKVGGNDLQFNDDMVPPNIFHRNFNLSFSYDYAAIDILGNKFGTGFKLVPEPQPVDEPTDE
jgi:hypothetical protein